MPARSPTHIEPMMARLSELPSEDQGWGIEIKWDGIRAIAHLGEAAGGGAGLRIEGRRMNEITGTYPELAGMPGGIDATGAVLDGELVALDRDGLPDFGLLQQRMNVRPQSLDRRTVERVPVAYMAFDLLRLDGEDWMGRTYSDRRARLLELGLDDPRWQAPAHATEGAAELLAAGRERGLEGLVMKRLDSPYLPGRRPSTWLKIKNVLRQEFVIGGWLPGRGAREGTIGSLMLGYADADAGDGERYRYVGNVGTGFDARELARLQRELEPLRRSDSPFIREAGPPRARTSGAAFVEPRLVAEVEFRGWTSDRRLRQASYLGIRDDKEPREVVLERALPAG